MNGSEPAFAGVVVVVGTLLDVAGAGSFAGVVVVGVLLVGVFVDFDGDVPLPGFTLPGFGVV